jgi:hypothetical protein
MFDDIYRSPDLWSQTTRRADVSQNQDTPEPDTTDPDVPEDAVLSDLWAEVETAYTKGYEQGVSVWVQNHRDDAITLLASLYSLTLAEAAEWLDDYTADAVTYLAESVDVELGATIRR